MPLSIEKILRAVPEMARFSKEQQEDLLKSFGPKALFRKAIFSAAHTGTWVTLTIGFAATWVLPKWAAGIVVGLVLLVILPFAYIQFVRQLRDEFQLLLAYLLTGATLPVCARCGYDMTGVEVKCPECGADVKWTGVAHPESEPMSEN